MLKPGMFRLADIGQEKEDMEERASAAGSVSSSVLFKISQGGAVATERHRGRPAPLYPQMALRPSSALRRSEVLRPRTEGDESASPKLRPAARPSGSSAAKTQRQQAHGFCIFGVHLAIHFKLQPV